MVMTKADQMKKLLVLVVGILLVAAPHFPASQVSEQSNNYAFLALTVIGALVLVQVVALTVKQGLKLKVPGFLKFLTFGASG